MGNRRLARGRIWRWLLSVLSAGAAVGALAASTQAEEGGYGHYLPGVTASFIDMLTGKQGFAYGNFPLYYSGSGGASRTLEFGGQVATNVKATIWADTSLLVYESLWHLLGGEYATAIAIPYMSVDVKGTVQLGPLSRRAHDSASGISDLEFFPLMLVWTEGDLKWGTNFGIFAPTGGFTKGNLANTGKNYWTFEPSLNISYLSTTTGLELTAFAGCDVNTQNDITNYQTGTQFHFDTTAAQHFPLFDGIAGIGANLFVYQQISPDSGSGALLGSFEGRTIGLGPVLSYVRKLGNVNLAAEVKCLPEIAVEHRLKGNIGWLKLAVNVPF